MGASTDCDAASASNVISEQPRSPARRTNAGQRRDGIPRVRQVLTVLGGTLSASEMAPVPPSASMAEFAVNMESTLVRSVRTCQGFAKGETTFPEIYGPMVLHFKRAPMPNAAPAAPLMDPPEIIGPRLRTLRLGLGIRSQTLFADAIGVEKNTYNPWEKGTRALTFEGALLIRRRFRIPLEWLFFGEFYDELPYRVRKAIDAIAA